jgi:hypothetical protein
MEYGFLVVEGQHEIEFVGRLLKKYGISRVTYKADLDKFWSDSNIIPTSFPPDDNLLKRVPIPVFFQNDDYSIAIHSAIGLDNIATTLKATLINNENILIESKGVGIIFDADYDLKFTIDKYQEFRDSLIDVIELPGNPGEILEQDLNTGAYILPDNSNQGTLENILIKCAHISYQNIYELADEFVDSVDLQNLNANDRRDIIKPTGKNKALIGCIGNILRPGKAIQVSLQDNEWICDSSLIIRELINAGEFIEKLFDLK